MHLLFVSHRRAIKPNPHIKSDTNQDKNLKPRPDRHLNCGAVKGAFGLNGAERM